MKDLNCFCCTGRLTADPELKYTPSGLAVSTVRVAVNKGREENGQTADFFNVELWRGAAEFAANYLQKGAQVSLQGRLKTRTWQDNNGGKRSTTEIVANEFNALGKSVHPGTNEQGEEPAVQAEEAPADGADPFEDQ